jgi:hypothetical protein
VLEEWNANPLGGWPNIIISPNGVLRHKKEDTAQYSLCSVSIVTFLLTPFFSWHFDIGATSMDSWFDANCGGKKGLGGKDAQLVSNLVVP